MRQLFGVLGAFLSAILGRLLLYVPVQEPVAVIERLWICEYLRKAYLVKDDS